MAVLGIIIAVGAVLWLLGNLPDWLAPSAQEVAKAEAEAELAMARAAAEDAAIKRQVTLELARKDAKYRPQMAARAAETGDVELLAVCLECGVRPTAKDADGETLLEIATRAGHRDIIALLEQQLAKEHSAMG